MKLKIIATILIVFGSLQIFAQELISNSGDSFSNATYQLDWSVGEVVTATHVSDEIILTQGFHQNNFIVTKIADIETGINILVFPNPTTDLINLQITDKSDKEMQYQLSDINGKLLQTQSISSDNEQINFYEYANGTYFLRVLDKNQPIKTFKIQKIN